MEEGEREKKVEGGEGVRREKQRMAACQPRAARPSAPLACSAALLWILAVAVTLPRCAGQGGLIPGSRLPTPEAVAGTRATLECFARNGTWVYDPTPRVLPWEPQGLAHCDLMWLRAGNSSIAGRVANLAQDPEDWNVRDTLKYRWEVAPQCQAEWKDFDAASFCDAVTALGGGLLLVGDSTSRQMFLSLYNHLVTATPPVVHPPQLVTPVPCKGWEASGSMPTSMLLCHAIWSCRGAGEGPLLFHTRNDRLTLNRRRPLSKNWEFYLPWLPLIKQWGVKVVVLNRGVHYTQSRKFAHQLERTMATLRRLHPGLLVVYRASVPGHLDCQNFSAPIREPQEGNRLPYNWGKLRHQNVIAKRLVEKYGGVFMDVEYQTSLRPDGHFGRMEGKCDCLHYCSPGPMDTWVQMLFNMLMLLSARQTNSTVL